MKRIKEFFQLPKRLSAFILKMDMLENSLRFNLINEIEETNKKTNQILLEIEEIKELIQRGRT